MNPIQKMEAAIKARYPTARITLDAAQKANGAWFLDVSLGGHSVTVEWHAKRGIGVTAGNEPGYGDGVDEAYSDTEAATKRVLSLLLTGGKSIPPETVLLRELRAERNLSQMKLAEILNVQQAAVSKMENRRDLLVSTLQTVVSAMGGRLIIKASFPGGIERELRFDKSEDAQELSRS